MTLDEIVNILVNRLTFLQSQRTIAVAIGDLSRVDSLDQEITETSSTLTALRSLE